MNYFKLIPIILLCGCLNQPPNLTTNELRERLANAADEHLAKCPKCKVSTDPSYGELVEPCEEYYADMKKANTIGDWIHCNQGWVLQSTLSLERKRKRNN